ncbi:hypothetical protein CHLNCDRAFT_143863 [Chlorella variabilis]|uniref:Uncharacterized protein n=1 Tax=Chlorella variabilis TaxID=554065 RepID=E1ZAL8_CHLVA|nr:hypothetical protein CHLNCDRAFT_143863 [Chlorella variabilis]EFN57086.1 hypothetical protein CHLNCDRAFT_143863 [Chlorella variabilis]|eukprot:XP_005849188.1 hypothetical protein CHLNCDRAFT_143863 [Chlorella variabilis]
MDLAGYQALVWSLSGVLLAFFAGFAIIYTYIRHKRQQDKIHFDQEEFITARRQVSTVRIGWSFFAGALGAWVISSPPAYTGSGYNYGAGGIGLAFYSLSSGLPVIMIAFAGEVIRRKVPHVLSLTDFMGWRYGYVAKTYVVLLCIFNMSIDGSSDAGKELGGEGQFGAKRTSDDELAAAGQAKVVIEEVTEV